MLRRSFLTTSIAAPGIIAAGAVSPPNLTKGEGHPTRPLGQTDRVNRQAHDAPYRISLKHDAIGVNGTADELLDAAIEIGYGALSVPAQWLEGWSSQKLKDYAAKAKDNDIHWGANGLPVEFRKSADRLRADLGKLPMHANNLAAIGVDRIGTWILPGSNELTTRLNFELHAERLADAARILREEGISLGLEYVGTQTLRESFRYGFISSGRELRELIDDIGEPNLGVVLDSFHWYNAGESADDLKQWTASEIIAVDVNDASAQLSRERQVDLARELPGATGVIDIKTFLGFLGEVNYPGPVRAEPFSATLNAMDDRLALQATYDAVLGVTLEAF